MARTGFLILLLLNLLLLAWIYLSGDARINAGREPQRTLAQIDPEKIRILELPDTTSNVCRAYTASAATAQEAASAFTGAVPAARIAVTAMPAAKVFEIVIAGIKRRSVAESTLAELKSLGLTNNGEIRRSEESDFTVVIAGYNERNVADMALRDLASRGLRLATIAERQPTETRALIEVRGSEDVLQKLSELAANNKLLTPASCAP